MSASLASRLWIYQSERFPLAKTAPLLAVFSAASIGVSAQLAGRDLPHWGVFLTGFILAMALFFQMRVCDEYKDLEDDRAYRPDRPIPRGLVSLGLILRLGLGTMGLAVLVAWLWYAPVLWLLALVWVWLALMTAEFGAPAWLKARPILYLLSHMAIMPLIDLLLTGLEWLPGGGAAGALWLFLALSFVNGSVLEIGRKLWAPVNEIEGVETYSGLWGVRRAALVWIGIVTVSYALLVGVGVATGTGMASAIIGALGMIVALWGARAYMQDPSPAAQKRMDRLAGLWVFLCYGTAGFLPYLVKAIA